MSMRLRRFVAATVLLMAPVSCGGDRATPAAKEVSSPAGNATASPSPVRFPSPDTDFLGTTSQGFEIRFTISRSREISEFRVDVRLTCRDGSTTVQRFTSGGPFGGGLVRGLTFVLFPNEKIGQFLRGTFVASDRAEGSARLFTVPEAGAFGETDCDSGEFTWSAEHSRRPTAAPEPIELAEAVGRGLVTFAVVGNGAASGRSLDARFTRRTQKTIAVLVPLGLVFRSGSAGVQDMVSGSDQVVVLDEIDEQLESLTAYCLNFHRANPSEASRFSLGGRAPSGVLAVLRVAEKAEPSPSAVVVQVAVWAVTDNVSRGELLTRFRATDADVVQARGLLRAAGIDPSSRRLYR